MKTVQFIPAIPKLELPKRLRVAAYCRVSTMQEIQCHSLETQRDYYKNYIERKCGWDFVGIYSDQALGRYNKKMKNFQQMLEDCSAGKIDKIIVKSISRLGRNTVEFLQAVAFFNTLKIDVYFEVENLHCYDKTAVKMLTIYASLYQHESESKSFATCWGHKARFESGTSKMFNRPCYGYKQNKNGLLEIDTEQAAVVLRIFAYRAAGLSLRKIADALMKDDVPAPRGGIRWAAETVRTILNNEKYYGSVTIGKTYVSDYFRGKQSKNTGEAPKYTITEHHEPIVK